MARAVYLWKLPRLGLTTKPDFSQSPKSLHNNPMKTNLYTVNAAIVLPVTSKTRLRRILTLLAFSVLAVAPADGGTIYEASNSADLQSHDFGTLNPSTRVFTSINSGDSALAVLGSTGDGTLYVLAPFGRALSRIN